MTANISARLPKTIAASVSHVAAAWRAMTPKHIVWTAVLCLAWSLFVILLATSFLRHFQLQPSVNAILSMQFNGFAVLFAVLIADQVSPPAHRRHWPYVVAVAVGVLAGTLVVALLTQRVVGLAVGAEYRANGADEQFHAFFFRHATHAFVILGLATCVYVSQRAAAHRVRALRAVQLEHAEMEKRLLESRLASMQARVEPGFLRQTLEGVARMYETDARKADLMLRDLIVYLRAAIPRVRQPLSTVEEELEVAEAYLNALGCGPGIRLMPCDSRSPIVGRARLPTMILVPLLHRARGRHVDRAGESFEIDAVIRDDRLCLTIRDRSDGFANDGTDDVALIPIRGRLAALYGDRARLALRATAGCSEAVLEIPYEIAADAGASALSLPSGHAPAHENENGVSNDCDRDRRQRAQRYGRSRRGA